MSWHTGRFSAGSPGSDRRDNARARDGDRPDRFGAKNIAYHQRVIASFDHFALTDPNRIRAVSADGIEGDVTLRLIEHLSDLL